MPSSLNFILQTNPKHLAENTPVDKLIVVDLMVDLNQVEFKQSHVILYSVTERKTVSAQVEYRSRSIKIRPDRPLEPNMHYQVELLGGEGKGLKTITGRYLEESYLFEFYTKDNDEIKPPVIFSPTNLSEVYNDVTFEWSTVPDAFYYELEVSKSNAFDTLVWPTEEDVHVYDGFVTPDIDFTVGTYYARMRTVDRDKVKSAWSRNVQFHYDGLNEVEAAPVKVEVEKESDHEVLKQEVRKIIKLEARGSRADQPSQLSVLQEKLLSSAVKQNDQLYVNKTSIKHNSLNLPITQLKEVVIEFSDDIDPESITRDTVYLIAERN